MAFLSENKKIIIGIPFTYSTDWIGGVYYIYNTVNALTKFNKCNINIEFLIDNDNDIIYLEQNIIYSKWGYRFNKSNTISKFEKLLYKLFKIKPSVFKGLDFLYLFNKKSCYNCFSSKRIVYWIGDLQNYYFPEYFDVTSLQKRIQYQNFLADSKNLIVATSNAMKSEFNQIYPNTKANIKVVQFSITANEIDNLLDDKKCVLEKYKIHGKYYYTPNQFWAHKNHLLLIESFKYVVEIFKDARLIFTGKENDSRNPDFFNSVKNRVNELNLQENISFLGFIPRMDQLLLIQNAHAIVQPSLYEGWSTVIEDAKVLGKKVIASNLIVHIEQLGNHGVYFNSHDSVELSTLLVEYFNKESESIDYNYDNQLYNSAISFNECFNDRN
jgi:glycosyltransferase involved in cell wall biosynthesis